MIFHTISGMIFSWRFISYTYYIFLTCYTSIIFSWRFLYVADIHSMSYMYDNYIHNVSSTRIIYSWRFYTHDDSDRCLRYYTLDSLCLLYILFKCKMCFSCPVAMSRYVSSDVIGSLASVTQPTLACLLIISPLDPDWL